ncbi:hypothetical protein SDC9_103851 [bioreactor metagenome]|uniref:Uncharacterized protein n=1 Tax=bioreactor metagenome TaxID=1076179 RepID=A0A645B1J3_9ZZZZ
MFVDTIYGKPVEHINRPHPFRVTFRQVIVYRYHVNSPVRKGIKKYRQGCYQCFSFTRCHFGNFTLVQHYTSKQLHIVVHHVPGYFVTPGNPVILIDSLIAFDMYKVVLGR